MLEKSRVYLIPDREKIAESEAVRKEYGASYEYNDFFVPAVLEDREKQEEIIEAYAKVRTDFSTDTIHGAFLDVTLHSMDPLIREVSERRVRQSMEVADRMGARGVVFHTNRLHGFREVSYLNNWKRTNRDFFLNLAEKFPEREILIENMFDESPDVLFSLAEEIKGASNIGICLDYAHAAAFGERPSEWIRQLAPYIRHMHLNDNDLKEDLHLPVGEGCIDWAEFEKVRREQRLEATALIEVKGAEKQRASLLYMKQNGIYL